MRSQEQVFFVRRQYNQWVANETLEDYALRFTAKRARKWSLFRVSQTALGAISFLALEAIGGTITLHYGFENALAAIIVVSAIIFLTGLPICYHAAKLGVDIDLLTRSAGFGYIGSTITSLIYASFTFIFFAIEAAILAVAIELTLNIPLSIGYIVSSLVVIPLVTHGITLITKFQVWTQPFWLILQVLPFFFIALHTDQTLQNWIRFSPPEATAGFDLIAFGAACSILFALIAQIGEQVDFLRFLPAQKTPSRQWWTALIAAGPGWIIPGMIKILIGSYLAVLAFSQGMELLEAADPTHMYLIAFGFVFDNPEIVMLVTLVFILLSQLKINVTNAYAGSIAWSNFFSRLTHHHPGRVVWVVFNVIIALLLMEMGVYRILGETLSVYAILAVAWVGTIVADLIINLPFGLRPKTMEFKRAHLFDINPVGVGSMVLSSSVGVMAHLGFFGSTAQALSSFVALGSAFVFAPLIAYLTRGAYYIAREPTQFDAGSDHNCAVCGHAFEPEDLSHCPSFKGTICSLCCTLDSRCDDICKPHAKLSSQFSVFMKTFIKKPDGIFAHSSLLRFLSIFIINCLLVMIILSLVYFQLTLDQGVDKKALGSALFNVFLMFSILAGVIAWMFTLSHDSRRVALEETRLKTDRLLEEIEAHQKTDLELQQAKNNADAANQAKSKYLTGISHELRSPLNSIMGYAQLLEQDQKFPKEKKRPLSVIRRSSEHLSDLIEGLLDISRIEAGKLELTKDQVDLTELLNDVVSMFELQAKSKNIHFDYQCNTMLPELVKTDEKRLRQILINLLSNAVKYTMTGGVYFSVQYRNQVAEFTIRDTGIGIPEADLEKIFEPFKRLHRPMTQHVSGTGLGLTITKLLTEMMGGDISIESTPNIGTCFTVSLMLSSINPEVKSPIRDKPILGYNGQRKTIMIVDDDSTHRSLLRDMLEPLGFEILTAANAEDCLVISTESEQKPDIYLLDISMPGLNGWQLAKLLRTSYPQSIIIITSANADNNSPFADNQLHNAYLSKPIRYSELLSSISHCSSIQWIHDNKSESLVPVKSTNSLPESPKLTHASLTAIREIIKLSSVGNAKGIDACITELQADSCTGICTDKITEMNQRFDFKGIIRYLECFV